MRVDEIDEFLPYHSHIHVSTTLNVIQYMENEINKNHQIYYDIYPDQEKKADKTKEETGLFFFRGKKNAPFAIICAGGGFSYVGSIHEAYPHAIELTKKGYNAFVIQYRTGDAMRAVEDLSQAIRYIFDNANDLGVSSEDYSLWGSSAGARMVAYLGSYGTSAFISKTYPKPVTVVMAYTGYSDYTVNDPATYAVVGTQDYIASPNVMKARINHLQKAGIDEKITVYPNLSHGFGLGIGTSAEGWLDGAVQFWEEHMHK